jgi:hypothetical protein
MPGRRRRSDGDEGLSERRNFSFGHLYPLMLERAEKEGRPVSQMLRDAVTAYLKTPVDPVLARAAKLRRQQIEAGRRPRKKSSA